MWVYVIKHNGRAIADEHRPMEHSRMINLLAYLDRAMWQLNYPQYTFEWIKVS